VERWAVFPLVCLFALGLWRGGAWFDVSAFGCPSQGQRCAAPLDPTGLERSLSAAFSEAAICDAAQEGGWTQRQGSDDGHDRSRTPKRKSARLLQVSEESYYGRYGSGAIWKGKRGSESRTPKHKPARPLQVSEYLLSRAHTVIGRQSVSPQGRCRCLMSAVPSIYHMLS